MPIPMKTDNARAAVLMTASMAFFAFEDGFIKGLTAYMGIGQILAALGFMGFLLFWAKLAFAGKRLWTREILQAPVIWRSVGEGVGAIGIVAGLAYADLASVSAIGQLMPLIAVAGAAVFLGETVGWRRWLSVGIGGVGMLMILRPGTPGFDPALLWTLMAVFVLVGRDLITRRMPENVQSDQLSALAYGAILPSGLIWMFVAGDAPQGANMTGWALLLGTILFGAAGYMSLVAATRLGESSAIAPFRYSRLVFAMLIAVIFFAERPDFWTITGMIVIVGSGAYAMWREARSRRKNAATMAGQRHPGDL